MSEKTILDWTFTKQQLIDYQAASGSSGLVHVNEEIAVPLFGGLVVQGALTTEMMFAGALKNGLWTPDLTETNVDARFIKLILAGRPVRGIARDDAPPGVLHLDAEVAEGVAIVMNLTSGDGGAS